MALFEHPNVFQFNALLRLGFAARLRSETADIFVAQNDGTLFRTDSRENAAALHFVSGDNTSVLKPIQAVVMSQHAEEGTKKFLTIGEVPTLAEPPQLLKIQLNDASSPRRMLFSLFSVAKPRKYLSLHGVKRDQKVQSRNRCTKWELFHLEIIPGSISKGLTGSPLPFAPSFLQVPEAISQVLLLLGVRFRLRSVHARILHRDVTQKEEISVLQTGARSEVNSSRDHDLIFVASRSSSDRTDPTSLCLYLKEVNCDRYLTIGKSDTNFPCARLITEKSTLFLSASGSLGQVNIGARRQGLDSIQWLMAGPRGGLEMRNHKGSWETFTIEYVQQSYNVALARVPVPPLYNCAEEATRDMLRAEISAKIAMAKGGAKKAQGAKSGTPPTGFDHAAALGGLSAQPKKATKPSVSNKSKQDTKGTSSAARKSGPAGSKTGAVASKAAAATIASSTLPRNKANRKAAKKNRKKQKGKQAKAPAARAHSEPGPSSTVNGPVSEVSPAVEGKKDDKIKNKSEVKHEESSSVPAGTPNIQGPKCAACGLPIAGAVTKAMGKEFHPQCFCCGMCKRPMSIGPSQFRERNGIPFCNQCYANHIASRCARCSKPIMDTVITAMDKTWHKDCLTCTICRLPLTQTFWLYADKPNEPRCSRCVTGEENVSGRRGGSSRMVNLPGFGPTKGNTPSLPAGFSGSNNRGSSGQPGRARLMTPAWPSGHR
ncbi:hypothetical protein FGB62_203g018 [Gracilaria domingensis]|nr:hypothetical protein FGB62_203g018 [Gracilaria domingensis]